MLSFEKWSFSTKLTLLIFALIVGSVGGSTYSFLQLYKKDKLTAVFQTELSNTTQVASHLENLLSLARVIDIEKTRNSKDIIYILENPCSNSSGTRLDVISNLYQKHFNDLDINPNVWSDSLELFKACTELNNKKISLKINAEKSPSNNLTGSFQNRTVIIPTKIQMMQPYIVALIAGSTGERLAVLSMDGFTTTAANTLFLTNAEGTILWAADGESYLQAALKDTAITPKQILKISQDAIDKGVPSVIEEGLDGLISYTKVGEDWAMISLSFKPTTLQPVVYATTQSIYLALGFAFLCLFIGRRTAILATQPLNDLRLHAERLGRGNFEERIQVTGEDEISVVKAAFNVMTDKIIQLIADTKTHTELQQELILAEHIQQMLIPEVFLSRKTYQISSYLKSANHCGGDWWGYIEIQRPSLSPLVLVMVGDVTGHGTASALVTATVRGGVSILESWINTGLSLDPRDVNSFLNSVVCQTTKGSIAMTFFTIMIDHDQGKIYCSNAGHNLPYLLTPSQGPGSKAEIKQIGHSGVPLGYSRTSEYEDLDVYPWPQGSKIFLYTDGLIECMKGEENLYDRKQLRKTLKANAHLNAKSLLAKTISERHSRIGNLPPDDDVTVVILESLRIGNLEA